MNIGIVGRGVVGSALEFGFKKLGHKVLVHDIKLGTKIEDLKDTEIIYICVPTPSKEDGSCDTSIVESVVYEINNKIIKNKYAQSIPVPFYPIIAIKSTVTPKTTQKLINKYGNSNICFVPEFLRERCAIADFIELNKILVIGHSLNWSDASVKIVGSHGNYPKQIIIVSPTEAELIKYYHNSINALHIVFANEMYEICKTTNLNYNDIKKAILFSTEMPDKYLDVSEDVRGYSSVCFNKDIPSLIEYAKSLSLDLPLLNTIPIANDKFKKTPFAGTRETY